MASSDIQVILEVINVARAVLDTLDVINGYELLNSLFRDILARSLRNVVQKDGNLNACCNGFEVLNLCLTALLESFFC